MRRNFLAFITFLFFVPAILSLVSGEQVFVQGQVLVISVQVLDELGNPVEGVLVHFYDETDGLKIGEDYSNSEGFASVLWNTSFASIGKHRLHIWNEEDPSIFVERSDTFVEVEIVSPAELVLSISSPSAVKPGEEFVITVLVSNKGGADALSVEVSINGIKKGLGNITAGSSSRTSFRIGAEYVPGNYKLEVRVSGIEQGTGRRLYVSKTISYRVKRQGISISLQAPNVVDEEAIFDFRVLIRNLGEDRLSFKLSVELDGASPSSIRRSGFVEADSYSSFNFSVRATAKDEIVIVAEVRSGELREKAVKKIEVRPRSVPKSSVSEPSVEPRPDESVRVSPAQENLTETLNTTETTFNPQGNMSEGQIRSSEGISGEGENLSPVSVEEEEIPKSSILPLILTMCILLLFSVIRRLWRVEEP